MDLNVNGYCFILLAFFYSSCQPEEQPVTSPKQAKPEHYRAKFEEHFEKQPDNAIYYLKQRKAPINQATGSLVGWQVSFNYGRHYFIRGDYGAAIDHNAKAMRTAENMGDSINLAKSLNMPDLLLSQAIQCLLMHLAGFFVIVHCSVHSLQAAFLGI